MATIDKQGVLMDALGAMDPGDWISFDGKTLWIVSDKRQGVSRLCVNLLTGEGKFFPCSTDVRRGIRADDPAKGL